MFIWALGWKRTLTGSRVLVLEVGRLKRHRQHLVLAVCFFVLCLAWVDLSYDRKQTRVLVLEEGRLYYVAGNILF